MKCPECKSENIVCPKCGGILLSGTTAMGCVGYRCKDCGMAIRGYAKCGDCGAEVKGVR
ncbi:MAG: hypothetical protein ACXQTJ_01680 [Candidatus Syntropharchaeales archaeon]